MIVYPLFLHPIVPLFNRRLPLLDRSRADQSTSALSTDRFRGVESVRGRVLIVENDHLTAVSLSSVLDLVGFKVVGTASRLSDALAQAKEASPQVAICGVELAGERDGIEGAALLREFLDIPVLLVTGRTDIETRVRTAKARPVAVLQKPVPSRVIISAVQRAMQEAGQDQP
jgi:DNA-binding NarL/FixJ family response regulator